MHLSGDSCAKKGVWANKTLELSLKAPMPVAKPGATYETENAPVLSVVVVTVAPDGAPVGGQTKRPSRRIVVFAGNTLPRTVTVSPLAATPGSAKMRGQPG